MAHTNEILRLVTLNLLAAAAAVVAAEAMAAEAAALEAVAEAVARPHAAMLVLEWLMESDFK